MFSKEGSREMRARFRGGARVPSSRGGKHSNSKAMSNVPETVHILWVGSGARTCGLRVNLRGGPCYEQHPSPYYRRLERLRAV